MVVQGVAGDPRENVRVDGHLYVHVAACECYRTKCNYTFSHTAHWCGNHLGDCRPCGGGDRCVSCAAEYEEMVGR